MQSAQNQIPDPPKYLLEQNPLANSEEPQPSPKSSASSKPILTIQKILDPVTFQSENEKQNNQTQTQKQQREKNRPRCMRCSIKQNQIRYRNRTIIIAFEETGETYCDQCLEQVLNEQQKQVKIVEQRFIYQKQFEASVNQAQIKSMSINEEDQQIQNLQSQVQALQEQQNQIDYQLGKAKNQCQELQQKVLFLEQKEQKFWSDMNKFQKRALKLEQKSFIAKNQGEHQKKSLENLSKTSMVHIFFKIQIQDNYAQVHGLVLGKKPEQLQINWQETNAAIGHLLLAYNYLVLKYGLVYTRIADIRIKGHLSQMLLHKSEMYYPVGLGVNNGVTTTTQKIFGILMECLLSQIADLAQHIQEIQNIEYSQELKLPFMIDKKQGKILDLHVNPTKLDQKTKWSQWTKAMRYFLIDFKHILTIASLSDPYL